MKKLFNVIASFIQHTILILSMQVLPTILILAAKIKRMTFFWISSTTDIFHRKSKFFKLSILFLSCMLLTIAFIISSNLWIQWQTESRLYSNIETVPKKSVALLLGVSKFIPGGQINLYFQYRIEAAVALYRAKKIKHIIVSGDNRTKYYNEPRDMKFALMQRGIPSEAITLDYAGFRTLDSVVRCKEIFSQDDIIVISQAFHNQRALFISDFYNIQAIGFNARDLPPALDMKTQIREYFAKVKMLLDLYILRTQPKFLGEKVKIPIDILTTPITN